MNRDSLRFPALAVVAVAVVGVVIAASWMLVSSDDYEPLPYATLTPTRAEADIINYDVSDVVGKADVRTMTVYLGVGDEENDVWNSSKFAIGESGYYEANLVVGNATFTLHLYHPDVTMLGEHTSLSLRCTSGEFEDRVPYMLRLRDGGDGTFITSASYYAP